MVGAWLALPVMFRHQPITACVQSPSEPIEQCIQGARPHVLFPHNGEDVLRVAGAASRMKRTPTDREQTVCLGRGSSVPMESDCKRSGDVDVHLICCKDLGARKAIPQVFNVQVLAPHVLLEFHRVLKQGFQCVDRAKNGLRLHSAAGYRYFNPRKPRGLLWIAKSSNNPAMCIAIAASKRFETASTLRRSTSCIFQDLVGGKDAASPVSPQTRVERKVANIFWLRFKLTSFCAVWSSLRTGCRRRRRSRAESLPESSANRRLCCRRCFSGLVDPEPLLNAASHYES